MMTLEAFARQLNQWGHDRVPFLFVVDFEMKKPLAFRIADISEDRLRFDMNGFTNSHSVKHDVKKLPGGIIKQALPFDAYKEKFDIVSRHLAYGDSYLTNLTVRSEVAIDFPLEELFHRSRAKYKLMIQGEFLVFSPETFVRIEHGRIFSYPMKGTIDAAIPDAGKKILADKKEMAEHVTIVDLIRNDLSQVAQHVRVSRFRYIEEIKTNAKDLLQVSSEISGELPADFMSSLGDILVKLLPAGSVSGAPKPKTIDIIREAERQARGYYTGVAGYFDGTRLDSGVMIRFIEQEGDRLFYRSGGGITTQSVAEDEYREVMDKVYVPFN